MKHIHNKKGMTLLELVIAVAVFSIAMGVAASIFASSMQGSKNTEKRRQTYERTQLAMNAIAKTMRTSSVIVPSSFTSVTVTRIRVFDYSQNQCVEFRVSAGKLTVSTATTKSEDCTDQTILDAPQVLSNSYLTGRFEARASNTDQTDPKRGLVTMSFEVCPGDKACAEEEKARIQTSVSLRDYFSE